MRQKSKRLHDAKNGTSMHVDVPFIDDIIVDV